MNEHVGCDLQCQCKGHHSSRCHAFGQPADRPALMDDVAMDGVAMPSARCAASALCAVAGAAPGAAGLVIKALRYR